MSADVCVVVPTVRERDCLRSYVENAREHGFDVERLFFVLVTEDFCDTDAMAATLAEEDVTGRVFDESARQAWFDAHGIAEYADLVPAASHAQTSFGLLYLWAHEFDYGVFLDDDTRPHPHFDFFGRHLRNLEYDGEVARVSSDTGWVNVLYQHADEHGLYPRGFPYGAMGETSDVDATSVDDVVVSQGLWTGVPDLDAVRILQDGDLRGRGRTRLASEDYDGSFVVGRGNYLTVCSMNLAFRREVVPAFYQLPMDDNPWGIGRFDDIWSGVFLKRACDVLGSQVLSGYPLCVHEKAPRSTFEDLAAEAPALAINERLWTLVADVGDSVTSYADVYRAMAAALASGDFDDVENGAFLTYLGEHMGLWLSCLEALEDGVDEGDRGGVPSAVVDESAEPVASDD